jgi:hypothetical protein
MSYELSWCINKSEFKYNYKRTIDTIGDKELSDFNKVLLRKRFIPMVNRMEIEAKRANMCYTIFQIMTTLGSILVPALLAIEDQTLIFNATLLDIEQQNHTLYWATWAISIAVTISNAFNQLLGLERKFITRNIHVSQMKMEGWSFLEKSGDVYSQHHDKSHDSLITLFWKRIEFIRHNQIKNDLIFDNIDDMDVDVSEITLKLSKPQNPANDANESNFTMDEGEFQSTVV